MDLDYPSKIENFKQVITNNYTFDKTGCFF